MNSIPANFGPRQDFQPPRPIAADAVRGREAAPGQLAKLAVQDAISAGAELPEYAQGMAASAIARGASAESVFAAMLPSDPPPVEPAPDPAPDAGDAGASPPTDVPDSVPGGDGPVAGNDSMNDAAQVAHEDVAVTGADDSEAPPEAADPGLIGPEIAVPGSVTDVTDLFDTETDTS